MSDIIANYRDRSQSRRPTRSPPSPSSSSSSSTTSERRSGRSSSASSGPERHGRRRHEDRREFSSSPTGNNISMMRSAIRNLLNNDAKTTGRPQYSGQESYVPSPKITFLIDQPKLTCQICQVTTLSLTSSGPDDPQPGDFDYDEAADATTAILPCAHVACTACLSTWAAAGHAGCCPFCREEHRRARCGHAVAPRPLTAATVASLPPTLPEGGRVRAECDPCSARSRERRARDRVDGLAARYVAARAEAEQRPDSGEAQLALRKAKRAFERCGQDVQYEEVMAEHTAW